MAAFDYNIDIIRAFPIPLHKKLSAPFRVIPVSTWFFVALILSMTGAIVYVATKMFKTY